MTANDRPDTDTPAPAHDEVGRRRAADDRLVVALLAGATYAQAAADAGVSERTVRRRLADPDFVERLESERRDLFDKATARLLSAVPIAQSTLVRICTTDSAPATARVNASKAILQYAREYLHDSTIEARLAQVEAALGRRQAR